LERELSGYLPEIFRNQTQKMPPQAASGRRKSRLGMFVEKDSYFASLLLHFVYNSAFHERPIIGKEYTNTKAEYPTAILPYGVSMILK
jgi:hypothetical protein